MCLLNLTGWELLAIVLIQILWTNKFNPILIISLNFFYNLIKIRVYKDSISQDIFLVHIERNVVSLFKVVGIF